MKLIQGHIYLSWDDLLKYGFNLDTLKKSTYRFRNEGHKSYANIPDPVDGKNLIRYDSIPEKTRIEKQMPTRDLLLRQIREDELGRLAKVDDKAFEIYYASDASVDSEDLQEMAAWMMSCAPMNRKQAREMGYDSVDGFYTDVMNLTRRKKLKGSVKNLRIFKRKLAPFYQYYKQLPHHFDPSDSEYYLTAPEIHPEYLSALESLISNKYGKRNAAKLKKRNDTDKQAEEQQALLIRLHADTIKLSIDQTWAAYMRRATQMMDLYQQTNGEKGWDDRCIITAQTVKNFLNAPEIRQIWYSKRHGKKPASNVFSVVTKRKSASFANAKWVIDGKPMQINFSHKGYNYSRIHAFVVIDEHSWAVVGYHLSFSENTDQVIMALRDACMRTKCLPHEIQADNSSAIVSWHAKHAIRSISKHFTLAQAGNARSKRIENFFGHFNAQILKFKPGFYGKHHNKLDHAVNEEEMARQIKGNLLPTFKEAYQLMDESFNEWNKIIFAGARPLEKYGASLEATKADQRQFTPEKDVHAFWYQPGEMKKIKDTSSGKRKTLSIFQPQEYTYSNKGIVVSRNNPLTKKRESFSFNVPDAAFNALKITEKFTLKIEPEDFSYARIYQDDRPILDKHGNPVMAVRTLEHSSAKVDHTPNSRKQLANELDRKEEQVEINEKRFERYMEVAAQNGHTAPIDTSWVHGKLHADNAIMELNEHRINAIKEANAEEPEEEDVVYSDQENKETISRF